MRPKLTVAVGAAVIASQCLLTAGIASAAGGGVAEVSANVLRYTAAAGDNNSVVISLSGGAFIVDDIVSITPGPGCGYPSVADLTRVQCLSAGVTSISVRAGDGNDVVNNTSATPSTLWGEAGDDLLDGGQGNDILRGDGGADRFFGDGGIDGVTYFGIAANVHADLDGVAGDDGPSDGDTIATDIEDLYGGNGNDTLIGNAVRNRLVGNAGNDTLSSGDDHDILSGGAGNDFLSSGTGNDSLSGGADNDTLLAFDGNDSLDGDAGDDRLFGHNGNDTLDGGTDDDTLFGGQDISISDFGGNDTFIGGSGVDTVSYLGHDGNVFADNDGAIGDDGVHVNSDIIIDEADTIGTDVENITGGNGNDVLTGNILANVLDGGLGNDRLRGGAGVDTASYVGRAAAVGASLDNVANDGQIGETDLIDDDVENITGGNGNDILVGDNGPNRLDGGPGSNSLNGLGGVDTCLNGVTINCP
jgi:Ca2+-binding RTX toxin-like protein